MLTALGGRPFRVLAIETSCDDTCVAIVSSCRKILSQVVLHQHTHHEPYQGIVPKIAGQLHRERLPGAIKRCLEEAGLQTVADVDVIAATRGPGLSNCLSTGFEAGRLLSTANRLPFYPVHHMEGHALTARMADESIKFPFLSLLISGGHTLLLMVRNVGDYTVLGSTRDDAVGEALDKATRMIGLANLPGESPAAALEAAAAQSGGEITRNFPVPMKGDTGLDFSFAGLKTSLKSYLESSTVDKNQVAREFQHAATVHLKERLGQAIDRFRSKDCRQVVIGGGVARNEFIRKHLSSVSQLKGMSVHFAPFELCSDNAVMIGWAAIENILAGKPPSDPTQLLETRPEWPLDALKL